MKVINLERGKGKTTRLLYASEFNNMPILCSTAIEQKNLIMKANEYGLKIPEPVTVHDVISNKLRGDMSIDKGILIDEAPMVLQQLLNSIGVNSEVKAITLTSDELK